MHSHTVAAEGGAATSMEMRTLTINTSMTLLPVETGCVNRMSVEYFVQHSPVEMTQLERWGCPWARKVDGDVNVRRFGGMKIERVLGFAAGKAVPFVTLSSKLPFSTHKFSVLMNISY